jgi:hypothetical protein
MGGIWVRSQDKKRLLLVNALDCDKSHLYKGDVSYSICAVHDNCLSFLLGSYPTETWALEVINQIQQFIKDRNSQKDDKWFSPVFEMPENGG